MLRFVIAEGTLSAELEVVERTLSCSMTDIYAEEGGRILSLKLSIFRDDKNSALDRMDAFRRVTGEYVRIVEFLLNVARKRSVFLTTTRIPISWSRCGRYTRWLRQVRLMPRSAAASTPAVSALQGRISSIPDRSWIVHFADRIHLILRRPRNTDAAYRGLTASAVRLTRTSSSDPSSLQVRGRLK